MFELNFTPSKKGLMQAYLFPETHEELGEMKAFVKSLGFESIGINHHGDPRYAKGNQRIYINANV